MWTKIDIFERPKRENKIKKKMKDKKTNIPTTGIAVLCIVIYFIIFIIIFKK